MGPFVAASGLAASRKPEFFSDDAKSRHGERLLLVTRRVTDAASSQKLVAGWPPLGDCSSPQKLSLHRDALFQAQAGESSVEGTHIDRSITYAMFCQHL